MGDCPSASDTQRVPAGVNRHALIVVLQQPTAATAAQLPHPVSQNTAPPTPPREPLEQTPQPEDQNHTRRQRRPMRRPLSRSRRRQRPLLFSSRLQCPFLGHGSPLVPPRRAVRLIHHQPPPLSAPPALSRLNPSPPLQLIFVNNKFFLFSVYFVFLCLFSFKNVLRIYMFQIHVPTDKTPQPWVVVPRGTGWGSHGGHSTCPAH